MSQIYSPPLNCTKSLSLSSQVRKSLGTCKQMLCSDTRAVDVSQPHRPASGTQEESSSVDVPMKPDFLVLRFVLSSLTDYWVPRKRQLKFCVTAWCDISSGDATFAHTCLWVLRCASMWWLECPRLPSREYCTQCYLKVPNSTVKLEKCFTFGSL